MSAWLRIVVILVGLLAVDGVAARKAPSRAQQASDAITELDVEAAQRLLDGLDPDAPAVAFERARLAIHRGDCDTASAILAAPTYSTTQQGAALGALARNCAGVVAGALVVSDEEQGVWIRLQDDADRVLVPYLVDVAVRSRSALLRELGVDLPRPLRLEIVRDVYSLSAITGLPVEAAETTGTIAVARWGRIAMISPRASPHGYPWEDTLAHEITHLVLTRASCNHAPLWLQEGIAKRHEIRWRSERPFDRTAYDDIARAALLAGKSVGIEKLGPSIAMLPSPEAARTAYAEVSSFMAYWVEQNGDAALRLLLADLRGVADGDADAAMRSVTGYELSVWKERWRRHLVDAKAEPARAAAASQPERAERAVNYSVRARTQEMVRRVRLGDLLFERGHSPAAVEQFEQAVASAGSEAAVRWRAARAQFDIGQTAVAKARLGDLEAIDGPSGPWFALRGRFLAEAGDDVAAEQSFLLGIALDPMSEMVACEGHWAPREVGDRAPLAAFLPREPAPRALCEDARRRLRQD